MAASTAPPSNSIGRRAVSLAGVAAWLTTAAGRKFNCSGILRASCVCD
jgi:hypothetical protein